MNVIKCDKCNKKRNDKNRFNWIDISVSGPGFSCKRYDFCEKCGGKIANALKKNFKMDKK